VAVHDANAHGNLTAVAQAWQRFQDASRENSNLNREFGLNDCGTLESPAAKVRSGSRADAPTQARARFPEVFDYEFDFGDSWDHRCTVLETGVAPEDAHGVRPKGPVAVWGWGMIPHRYGRAAPEG
jgi:hypothetical protein